MRHALLSIATIILAACSNDSDHDMTLHLRPTPNALVDNLFIARSPGMTAAMGGAAGRFFLMGRCLILKTDEVPRTPVFPGQVIVSKSGIATAGRDIPYGSQVSLPMIGAPLRIAALHGTPCPEEAVIIRSFGD